MRYWNLAGWTATCEVLECIAMADRQLADNLFALQVVPTALQTSTIKAENVTNIGKTLALTTNKNIIMITSNIFSVANPDPTRSGIFCPRCPDFPNPYSGYESILRLQIQPHPTFPKVFQIRNKIIRIRLHIFTYSKPDPDKKKIQQTFYEIYKKSYVYCF